MAQESKIRRSAETRTGELSIMQQCSIFTALYNEQKKDKGGGNGGKPKIDLLGNQSKSKINLVKLQSVILCGQFLKDH